MIGLQSAAPREAPDGRPASPQAGTAFIGEILETETRHRLQSEPVRASSGRFPGLCLLASDLLALSFAAVTLAVGLNLLRAGMNLDSRALPAGVLWISLRAFGSLYPGYGLSPPHELRRCCLSTVLAASCHLLVLASERAGLATSVLAASFWGVLLASSWVIRELIKSTLERFGAFGKPMAVIGAGKTGALLIRELQMHPGLGLVPVALFDDDPAKQLSAVHGVPVIGRIADANAWAAAHGVRAAIVAIPGAPGPRLASLSRDLSRQFDEVRIIPNTFGLAALWVRPMAAGSCLTLEVCNSDDDRRYRAAKRALDLLLAVPLFAASLPLIAVAALAVKRVSPGRAFFAQEREGHRGKRIRVWKIRTMSEDAETRLEAFLGQSPEARREWSTRMKLRDDPRIIPRIGTFLRRYSIDELPQFWNVITGDMSLVGPRPFPDYHLELFPKEFRELRRQVPPGVTGLWQVTYRSDGDLSVQEAADFHYISNRLLWLDLWILARTPIVVLSGKGAS